MIEVANIFKLPELAGNTEFAELLAEGDAKIERIISSGQTTPADEWYDQDSDEWVVLLDGEARLLFERAGEITLKKGDYLLIKAHERHRVTYTSNQPMCIWLAVHCKLTS